MCLKLSPIPPGIEDSDHDLRQHDLLVAPMGFAFPGESEVVFRDRWVCIVDPANPRLRDGWLSLEEIGALPRVVAVFGANHLNPGERVLDELGVRRRTKVRVRGWLAVPFVIAGTDMVAIVPGRLARRVERELGVLAAEPPLGSVDLVEAVYWQPSRAHDPALCWMRRLLRDTGAGLRPAEQLSAHSHP